jgi:HD-GYP domain-containing protein (c-di-GMP phosphodiesterase class II)
MKLRFLNRPALTISMQLAAATSVLGICLFYAISAGFVVPYPGLVIGPDWIVTSVPPCTARGEWCSHNAGQILTGDRILSIGSLTYQEFTDQRTTPPFWGYAVGETAKLRILRNGREQTVSWVLLGPTAQQRASRLSGILIFLPFWLVGTGVLFLVRPHDERWRLLIFFNFVTAIWATTGVVSYLAVARASQVLHAASWIMAPVYLRFHLIVPSPIRTRFKVRPALPAVYALASLLALSELFRLLPDSAYGLALVLAVGGSLGILFYRIVRRPPPGDRPALALMLTGIILGMLPGLAVAIIPNLLGSSTYQTVGPNIAVFAIPVLPAFYSYAIYKRQLGTLEVRANRLLIEYSFLLLYVTGFTMVFAIGSTLLALPPQSVTFSAVLSIAFFLLAIPMRAEFRRLADRLAYGTRYRPDELVRRFADRIPYVLDRGSLLALVREEVLPALLVRQWALLTVEEKAASVRGSLGVNLNGKISRTAVDPLVASSGIYRAPGDDLPPPFQWVRLVVALRAGEKLVGVWLLGRRDPDDFYPHADVTLLQTLANQLAPAIETVRLLEETAQRADEFAALYETARDLASDKDVNTLLGRITERAISLLHAECGAVYLYDRARNDLALATSRGVDLGPAVRIPLGQGTAGRVAEERVPAIIDDYTRDAGALPALLSAGIRAMVQVPMVDAGELIGVLGVAHLGSTAVRFGEEDVRLLTLFATRTAGAVRNARLIIETRTRAEQMELLYDAGLALNSVLEPRAQLQILFEKAMHSLHAERAEYFTYDPTNDEMRPDLAIGFSPAVLAEWNGLRARLGDAAHMAAKVASERKPLRLGDVRSVPGWRLVDSEVQSGMWVTIEREGILRGVLGVLSTHPEAFSDQDERLLTLFANQAAVALENARLFAETELRLQRLSASRSIDAAISSSLDLRVTLNVLLDQVTTQLGIHAADVLLLNPHTQTLEFAAGRGFRSSALQRTRLRLGAGYAGRAALERRRVTITNLHEAAGEMQRAPLLIAEGFVTYFGVPLIAKGQVKGVLEILHRSPLVPDSEWFEFLETLAGQAAIAIDNGSLFDSLQRSNLELTLAYDTTLEGWSRAIDLRDREPEGHTERVTEATLRLGRAMGMGEEELVHVRRGALLHDVGKMGIPDSILLKPGPLTEREWSVMRRHPTIAYELLSPIEFLRPAIDVPYCHHEKWDGSGYPRALTHEQIPLAARVFSIVDVWDSLRSDRPYRDAWAEERTRAHVWDEAGKHFDPNVVEVFLEVVIG